MGDPSRTAVDRQSSHDTVAERRLWEAFCAGDDIALDLIYRRYVGRLCRDAQRFVSADQAWDIVHDVFAVLLARRTSRHPHGSLRLYLHSAVRNRARDVLARTRTDDRYLADDGELAATLRDRTPPETDAPLLLEELTRLLADAIATCGARAQEVLLLSDEIRRYAEIGTQLGISPNTVHNLLTRTRHRLRAILQDAGWDRLPRPQHHPPSAASAAPPLTDPTPTPQSRRHR